MRDLRKIEKQQYKALKYVYNDFNSSYTDLRIMANRPLMYIERQRSILLEVYKCLNQISPVTYVICLRLKWCLIIYVMRVL